MKPKSRRYAGTRGLARPAAAGYLLYFRCRFDTLDQGSRIPIKVQLKTGSSTQGRRSSACSAANKIRHDINSRTLGIFDFWGICNAVHTFRVWARPSGRSLVQRFISFFRESSRLTSRPARLTAGSTERRNSRHIFGPELRVKPARRVRAAS